MVETAKPQILIMEDDPANMQLLSYLLRDQYTILPATTGQKALEIVENETFDLAILDIMMPDIDGYEVCQTIKKSNKTCLIPVLIITALSQKEAKIKGIECGADDFLTKPFDTLEVEVRVKTLIEKRNLQLSFIEEGQRLKKYVDATKSLFVVLNKDQNVEMVNRTCCDFLGLEESQIIGQNWFNITVPAGKSEKVKKLFNEKILNSNSSGEKIECEFLAKNDQIRVIRYRFSSLNENSKSGKYILSGIDVTKEKKLEKLTAKYTEELEFSNTLNDLLRDIMRYELLAPADSVREIVDNILQTENNEYKINLLQSVVKTIEGMEDTIKRTSNLAEIDSLEQAVESYDLVLLLKELIEYFEFEIEIKNLNIIFDCEGDFRIPANEPIKDVIKGMLSNAINRSPEASVIKIDLVDYGDFLKVNFLDNGQDVTNIGQLAKANLYSNLNPSKNQDQIFTLISKIMTLYGGEIGVENDHGTGFSIFWVKIKKI